MTATSTIPDFCQGIKYFGASLPEFDKYAGKAAIAAGKTAIIAANDPNAIYQTLLAADALRYLTLQITATKESGHPAVLPALPT
jgi:phosphoketolase